MSVRAFPRTRNEPRKRILLIPVILIVVGYVFMILHPYIGTGLLGIVLSLAGVLTVFLVGMVFADLWAASRRTKEIIKARETRMGEVRSTTSEVLLDDEMTDPFEEDI